MNSSDWCPMQSAPLNPCGERWGPAVLIWDRATETPVSAYFDPWHGYEDRDGGPAWIVNDGVGDSVIAPEDAEAWMPIESPQPDETTTAPEEIEMPKASGSMANTLDDHELWGHVVISGPSCCGGGLYGGSISLGGSAGCCCGGGLGRSYIW